MKKKSAKLTYICQNFLGYSMALIQGAQMLCCRTEEEVRTVIPILNVGSG